MSQRAVGLSSGVFTRHSGFTLLELLVVVLIIGLLSGIVAPRLLSQIWRSEATAARAQMSAFDKALQSFRIDMGRYPSDAEGLRALVVSPSNDPRWRGPYLSGDVPLDPWGQPYQYRAQSSRAKDYEIVSLGGDRVPGGSDAGADISN